MAELLPNALALMCRKSPDMIVRTGDVLDVDSGPGVDQDLKLGKTFFVSRDKAPYPSIY